MKSYTVDFRVTHADLLNVARDVATSEIDFSADDVVLSGVTEDYIVSSLADWPVFQNIVFDMVRRQGYSFFDDTLWDFPMSKITEAFEPLYVCFEEMAKILDDAEKVYTQSAIRMLEDAGYSVKKIG